MAAIPTILKGDDSGTIEVVMAAGHSYTGATLVLAYQGVTRKFTNLAPGMHITFSFSHAETSGFALGGHPMLMRLIGAQGAEETIENAEARIKVTDCMAEVSAGGSFIVRPASGSVPVTDVGDVPSRYTLAEIQAKVNEIVRVLAQRSLLALAVAVCAPFFAVADVEVQTARLDSLYNDSLVVTNVTGGGSGGGGVETNAVKDIINAEVGGTNAVKSAVAAVATKQDALPFATNAIPAAAIASAPWFDEAQVTERVTRVNFNGWKVTNKGSYNGVRNISMFYDSLITAYNATFQRLDDWGDWQNANEVSTMCEETETVVTFNSGMVVTKFNGDGKNSLGLARLVDLEGIAAPDYANVSNKAMTALQAHQSLAPATNYVDAVAAGCVKTNGAQTIVGSLNIKNGNGLSAFEVAPDGAAIQIRAVANLSPRFYLEGEYDAPTIVLKSGGGRGTIEFRDEDLIYSLKAHASGDIAVTDDLTNLVAKTEADSTSVFSTNLLALADAATATKLATETMYKMTSGTAYEVGSNTVQYIDLSAATLPINFTPPTSVSGRASDWVVYCFASADTANAVGFGGFGANHLWATDAAATNAAVKTGITMFVFSQIKSDTFVIGRQELKSVSN